MPKSLPPKVAVRRAAPRDEKRWRELFDGYCLFYKRPLSEPLTRHTWARILDDASPIHAAVAEDRKDGVIGIANYVVHEHTLGLTPACYLVSSTARDARQGLASSLLAGWWPK